MLLSASKQNITTGLCFQGHSMLTRMEGRRAEGREWKLQAIGESRPELRPSGGRRWPTQNHQSLEELGQAHMAGQLMRHEGPVH